MTESLAHRGPDGFGVWVGGSVGVGHRMLHTTPESLHEELPLVKGHLSITADARIDNRDELIATLNLSGRPKEEVSDSELILLSYERWGERCPEQLLGDFAFAIWDGWRDMLFCASDHMGVKPFYYYHKPGRIFVLGSEIKALLSVKEVPRRLNETRVGDYLVSNLEDKEITFYEGIFRLPPAHSMVVDREGAMMREYWSLDPTREVWLGSDGEYAEAFRAIFTEAVRCRLRSAFPVGSTLSGGLDSSSVVCVARDLLAREGNDRRLRTFSAVFPEVPECDESIYIDAVLAKGGVGSEKVRADQLSPLDDIERVLWHEDEAFYASNLFMHWALYSAANRWGVRVFLDGDGGDSTVSHGVGYLAELAIRGRWVSLASEIGCLSTRFNRSPWNLLLRFGLLPLVPGSVRQAWRTLRGRQQQSPWGHDTTVINADFAQRIGMVERYQALQGTQFRPARSEREDHWRELTAGVNPFALQVFDKAAAAFSIEPRYPFFDRRLMEFCFSLPADQKLSGGWSRVVVRRALVGTLPEAIRWRGGKANLSPNFTRGLLDEQEFLEGTIQNDLQTIWEYADVPAVREAYRRFVSQGTTDDALKIWSAISLALWLRYASLN